MNLKRISLICIALLIGALAAYGEPASDTKGVSVRSFTFKYKDANKAAAAIKPLMSSEGSISIQPSNNTLVVTDHAENLKAIGKTLTEFDAPAQSFKLSIRLVSASRVDGNPAIKKDLEDVAAKMAMFRFNSFESAGEANLEGKEGDSEVVDLAPNAYRADFKIGEYDPASDSIKVSDFRLSRLQNDQLTQLIKTTLNLRIGQMYIVGASKAPQSQHALMIVITARR